ncbi:MAG: hypothetical protein ACK47B_09590 [Armatimonadota bacterium]
MNRGLYLVGMGALAALLTLSGGGARDVVAAPAAEPIRDAQGNEIGGFENWGTGNARPPGVPQIVALEPVGWTAKYNGYTEISGVADPVTQTKGKNGAGVRGQVLQWVDQNQQKWILRPELSAGPYLEEGLNWGAGVPVSKRHAQVTGMYQFKPKKGDGVSIYVEMYRNGQMIGQGGATSRKAQKKWKKFKAPIFYFGSGNPDTARILIQIVGKETRQGFKEPTPGSYYLVDEVKFAGVAR